MEWAEKLRNLGRILLIRARLGSCIVGLWTREELRIKAVGIKALKIV